jgi:hypothetical protein
MKRHKYYKVDLVSVAMITLALVTLASGKTIYVDDDAVGTNDGSSREETYVYLQNALVDADDSNRFDRKGGLLCLRIVFTIA